MWVKGGGREVDDLTKKEETITNWKIQLDINPWLVNEGQQIENANKEGAWRTY